MSRTVIRWNGQRIVARLAALAIAVGFVALAGPAQATTATDTFTGDLASGGNTSLSFSVPTAGTISATLDWDNATSDLNMWLRDPSVTQVAAAATANKPETLTFAATRTGNYSILVKAKTGAAHFTLTVSHPGTVKPPPPPTFERSIGTFATAEISPVDTVADAAGNWYVMDEGLECIKVYDPSGTQVLRTMFTCGVEGNDNTHITRARGIGFDRSSDSLWIADTTNNRVLKVSAADGTVLANTSGATSPGGTFNEPVDVAADDSGNAYVTDAKDRIVKLSPTGDYLAQFGSTGSAPGQIKATRAIAFSSYGTPSVYVTDTANYRVSQFTTDGTFVRTLGKLGTKDGQMTKQARGIAVGPDGTVYVADVGGNRIIRWNAAGTALTSIGTGLPYHRTGQGDLAFGARGIEVVGNTLVVCDMWNYRTLFWDLSGTPIGTPTGQIGGSAPPPGGLLEPRGVARDAAGNVYVSDYWHQFIQKFAPDGTFLARWGIGRGDEPGSLNLPGGIDVDDTHGFLYIANRESRVVDRWRLSDGGFDKRYQVPAGPSFQQGWPRDVAVDEARNLLFIADEKNFQISVLDATTGAVVRTMRTYGAGLSMGAPYSVALDSSGGLYVADSSKHLIHVYDSAGTWQRDLTVPGQPVGVDVQAGKVYVLSPSKVYVLGTDGTMITSFGSAGAGNNQLTRAFVGITADPSTGEIYVGDSENHLVKVFH